MLEDIVIQGSWKYFLGHRVIQDFTCYASVYSSKITGLSKMVIQRYAMVVSLTWIQIFIYWADSCHSLWKYLILEAFAFFIHTLEKVPLLTLLLHHTKKSTYFFIYFLFDCPEVHYWALEGIFFLGDAGRKLCFCISTFALLHVSIIDLPVLFGVQSKWALNVSKHPLYLFVYHVYLCWLG